MSSFFHWAGQSEPSLSKLNRELSSQSLHHYATPGVTPPSARVNPRIKVQPRRPISIWDAWKWGLFVVSKGEFKTSSRKRIPYEHHKATEITGDVLSHHVWGPRKKSWGIEMTIVSSIMRGAGRHSSLVDIVRATRPHSVSRRY